MQINFQCSSLMKNSLVPLSCGLCCPQRSCLVRQHCLLTMCPTRGSLSVAVPPPVTFEAQVTLGPTGPSPWQPRASQSSLPRPISSGPILSHRPPSLPGSHVRAWEPGTEGVAVTALVSDDTSGLLGTFPDSPTTALPSLSPLLSPSSLDFYIN